MALTYPVKGISVFRDLNYGVGWTETVHLTNTIDLKTCLDDLHDLNKARVKMLGSGVKLEYMSVSQDDPKFLGDVEANDGLPFTSIAPPVYNKDYSGLYSDFAWTAVLCRASSLSLYHRQLWLSGIPDSLTHDEQLRMTDPDWIDLFKAWRNILINTKYGIKAWSKDLADSPIKDIIGTGVGNPGVILTKIDHEMVRGDTVFVHGVHGDAHAERPHGQYQVGLVPDARSLTLIGWRNANFDYLKGGYVRKRVMKVFPIDSVIQRSLKKKSRGRPLFLQRGRSRVRKA